MKHLYTTALIIISLLSSPDLVAQADKCTHMLRVQEDNDFLNLIGARTDRSYTNGTRIDYFQSCRLPRHSFLSRIIPTTGDSSIYISGWSMAQLMVTPSDITKTEYQPDDYPYAGSLFITRSFHSLNPIKKFSYQTELLVGIRGPHAMAKQTQTVIHSAINSQKPLGWDNQLNTQLLINLTFTAEKNLLTWGNVVELNGGIQTRIGSLMDAVLIYPTLRIGKMTPYFNGFLSQSGQRKSNFQYFLVVKPTATFVAYNSMIKGTRTNAAREDEAETSLSIAHYIGEIQMGAVIAYRNISLSYLLTRSSSYDKGLYEHRYGTVEICVRW